MGLFDNLKDKLSDAVGIDADEFVEATEQVADVSGHIADTAEAIRDTRDSIAGE